MRNTFLQCTTWICNQYLFYNVFQNNLLTNIQQETHVIWWGFKQSLFLSLSGTSWLPRLLFRLLFRVRLGRSIVFPSESTGLGERAWWSFFQQSLSSEGWQTCTRPTVSLVQPMQIVLGLDSHAGLIQVACIHVVTATPGCPYWWYFSSTSRIGTNDSSRNRKQTYLDYHVNYEPSLG